MQLIIGFAGRAKHGKTTATEAIVEKLTHGRVQYRHKMPLVRVYDIGDMVRRWCIANGRLPEVPRKDMTPDQLQILINVGREQRAVDVNFWIAQMFASIETESPLVAICPNIRYPNEVEAVRAHDGFIVRCTRYNVDGSVYISPDRPPNDQSETRTEMILADYYLASREGEDDWMRVQAVALFNFLWGRLTRGNNGY